MPPSAQTNQSEKQDGTAPLITWLGDDFTGAAAVMEVLSFAGVPSVLFTEIPSDSLRARFADRRAIGIASTARSKKPDWMQENLPRYLRWLDELSAPILHYKVCSTFDSSPDVGSIGQAIETGLSIRPSVGVPLLTAAPQMRRYQAFGNLFASSLDGVQRLDRHPVMSRHPVTPMDDADLLLHVAQQTALPSQLIDLEMLATDPNDALKTALDSGAVILSIDSMDALSEEKAGQLLWENREKLRYVVGSQGVEFALVRHWCASGLLEPALPPESAGEVDAVVAVSGSVSPTTAEQLSYAAADGFELIEFPATSVLLSDTELSQAIAKAVESGSAAAERGASPLVFTARGPDDPAVDIFKQALSTSGVDAGEANARVGVALGRVLDGILRISGIRRAVISGGDTSGYGMQQLGLQALVALAPTIPGASICTGYGDSQHDGLEIALKGGQMGSRDFFSWVRRGGGAS